MGSGFNEVLPGGGLKMSPNDFDVKNTFNTIQDDFITDSTSELVKAIIEQRRQN